MRARRKTRPPFRIKYTFDLGGIGVSGHHRVNRRAATGAEARSYIAQVRTSAIREGGLIIPGHRLVYARIYDERRKKK